jgi:hypothetical protein
MPHSTTSRALAALTILLSLVVPAPRAGAADGALLEKTIAVPRETAVPLDLTYEKTTLTTVETHNDPKASDLDEARAVDPKDITFLIVRFRYRSDDFVKHKVNLRTVLLTEEGAVVGEAGRSATLDPRKKDDTVSFPMKIKTLDWPKATSMKVTASFLD